jgi:fructose-specific phosphotransferase system IIC component
VLAIAASSFPIHRTSVRCCQYSIAAAPGTSESFAPGALLRGCGDGLSGSLATTARQQHGKQRNLHAVCCFSKYANSPFLLRIALQMISSTMEVGTAYSALSIIIPISVEAPLLRHDLHKKPRPPRGTPVLVWYLNEDTYDVL